MQDSLRRITMMVVTTTLLFSIVLGAISSAGLRRQRMWQAMREEHMRRIEAARQRAALRRLMEGQSSPALRDQVMR